jgi:hypothetical protein
MPFFAFHFFLGLSACISLFGRFVVDDLEGICFASILGVEFVMLLMMIGLSY